VPFAPAGSSDVPARVLQSPLQQELGQTVIVENRASANIGTAEVARAAPDGLHALLTSSAFVADRRATGRSKRDRGECEGRHQILG